MTSAVGFDKAINQYHQPYAHPATGQDQKTLSAGPRSFSLKRLWFLGSVRRFPRPKPSLTRDTVESLQSLLKLPLILKESRYFQSGSRALSPPSPLASCGSHKFSGSQVGSTIHPGNIRFSSNGHCPAITNQAALANLQPSALVARMRLVLAALASYHLRHSLL